MAIVKFTDYVGPEEVTMRDWLESDPEAARAWIGNNAELADSLILSHASDFAEFDLAGIAYRCPVTPDLFAGN